MTKFIEAQIDAMCRLARVQAVQIKCKPLSFTE